MRAEIRSSVHDTHAEWLVDRSGARGVHDYRAIDIPSHNRIAPQGSATSQHAFAIPAGCASGKVTTTLLYRPVPVLDGGSTKRARGLSSRSDRATNAGLSLAATFMLARRAHGQRRKQLERFMSFAKSLSLVLPVSLFLGACGGEPDETDTPSTTTTTTTEDQGCKADADCAGTPESPLCDVPSGECLALPPGHQVGFRDGSPGTVALVVIHEPDKLREPVDLAFNPSNLAQLWVTNRKDGSVILIDNPGTPESKWVRMRDPAASHFMNRPPAMAFGVVLPEWGQTFAVCGDGDNGGDDFMGPALFTANLDIFATQTPGGLGSHLDMLHSTTFCRGIAHVEESIYFVFNSTKKSLDRYDFGKDHGPGNDDHADGRILRYAQPMVLGVDGIPSHLVYSPADKQLYVADTGNKRIAKLDTLSGEIGNGFGGLEPVEERKIVQDAVLVDVVPPGTLEAPSGIELHDDLLFVTDNATSRFYVFDLAGKFIRHLDTGLPPGSLAGFTFGPDGKVYFTDMLSSRAYRIDPLF